MPVPLYCGEGGTCSECLGDADCDDGSPCTTDFCGVDGMCHYEGENCCTTGKDCDDGDWCTADLCHPTSMECYHEEIDNPLCCNTNEDCLAMVDNQCMNVLCYQHTASWSKWCRFGPPKVGCCETDADCPATNPCKVPECHYDDDTAPTGICMNTQDPGKPGCCLTHNDCDDDDEATIDLCVEQQCVNQPDPDYCALPATSAIVIHELMVAPGSLADADAEWIEIYNASAEVIDLTGWRLVDGEGQEHEISADHVLGSSSMLKLIPGTFFVLGRSADKDVQGGFVPHYVYGEDVDLPDPFEDEGFVSGELTLEDADGQVVDTVHWDASWSLEDGRSLELTHAFRDNAQAASWEASGHAKNPALNKVYGDKAVGLYGTPKLANLSSFQGLLDKSCVPAEDAHPCAEGRCDMASQCVYPLAEGCCVEDVDCVTFDPCVSSVCDTNAGQCTPPDGDAGCCSTDAQCEDDNACNLDRCLGNECRYSPPVIPGCCYKHDMCDDGDPCTADLCDVLAGECHHDPVILQPGQTCCVDPIECDDGQVSTLNQCDVESNLCVYPPDPEHCTEIDAPCDDGDGCTVDACDVQTDTCIHALVTECCQADAECDDGFLCTADVCQDVPGQPAQCVSTEIEGCCLSDAECDDGVACTADVCGTNNVCHSTELAGCCDTVADCEDGVACTVDTCIGNVCKTDYLPGCCNPNADQETLAGVCGEDPDGAGICFQWTCGADGSCQVAENAECCDTSADCDDGSACTLDACVGATGLCKYIPQPALDGCCELDSDCPAGQFCDEDATCTDQLEDDEPCTGDNQCQGGVCTEDDTCDTLNPPAWPCDSDDQCTTGRCFDGICCVDDALLGESCDGEDGDLCLNGTWSCMVDGSDKECVNEDPFDIHEVCNGMDDTCDGQADEEMTPPVATKTEGVCVGAVKTCGGTQGWKDAEFGAIAGYELVETLCDGLDNDCDGLTDEDLTPPGDVVSLGVCEGAEWVCNGVDGWEPPAYVDNPSFQDVETLCDGLDNDCDGLIDEELTAMPAAVQAGVCVGQLKECAGPLGWVEPDYAHALKYQPVETLCDGLDNDCDGLVDEDLLAPPAWLNKGVCKGLDQVCEGAASWSEPDYESVAQFELVEVSCDALDNDCDGQTDEDIDGCEEIIPPCALLLPDGTCGDDLFEPWVDEIEEDEETPDPCTWSMTGRANMGLFGWVDVEGELHYGCGETVWCVTATVTTNLEGFLGVQDTKIELCGDGTGDVNGYVHEGTLLTSDGTEAITGGDFRVWYPLDVDLELPEMTLDGCIVADDVALSVWKGADAAQFLGDIVLSTTTEEIDMVGIGTWHPVDDWAINLGLRDGQTWAPFTMLDMELTAAPGQVLQTDGQVELKLVVDTPDVMAGPLLISGATVTGEMTDDCEFQVRIEGQAVVEPFGVIIVVGTLTQPSLDVSPSLCFEIWVEDGTADVLPLKKLHIGWCMGEPLPAPDCMKGQMRTVRGRIVGVKEDVAIAAYTASGMKLKALINPKNGRFALNLPKDMSATMSVVSKADTDGDGDLEHTVRRLAFVRNNPETAADPDLVTFHIPDLPFKRDADIGVVDFRDVECKPPPASAFVAEILDPGGDPGGGAGGGDYVPPSTTATVTTLDAVEFIEGQCEGQLSATIEVTHACGPGGALEDKEECVCTFHWDGSQDCTYLQPMEPDKKTRVRVDPICSSTVSQEADWPTLNHQVCYVEDGIPYKYGDELPVPMATEEELQFALIDQHYSDPSEALWRFHSAQAGNNACHVCESGADCLQYQKDHQASTPEFLHYATHATEETLWHWRGTSNTSKWYYGWKNTSGNVCQPYSPSNGCYQWYWQDDCPYADGGYSCGSLATNGATGEKFAEYVDFLMAKGYTVNLCWDGWALLNDDGTMLVDRTPYKSKYQAAGPWSPWGKTSMSLSEFDLDLDGKMGPLFPECQAKYQEMTDPFCGVSYGNTNIPRAAGTYCEGNTLLTCSGSGSISSSQVCGNGCQVTEGAADTCVASDFCAGKANGGWCDGDRLVTCSGGSISAHVACVAGCQSNEVGVADVCKATGSTFCDGRDDGAYCHEDSVVTCAGGSPTAQTTCARGCQWSPWEDDHCLSFAGTTAYNGDTLWSCDTKKYWQEHNSRLDNPILIPKSETVSVTIPPDVALGLDLECTSPQLVIKWGTEEFECACSKNQCHWKECNVSTSGGQELTLKTYCNQCEHKPNGYSCEPQVPPGQPMVDGGYYPYYCETDDLWDPVEEDCHCFGLQCGDDDGCGNVCKDCPDDPFATCSNASGSWQCEPCAPDCTDKECGQPDGCGQACTDCPSGFFCEDAADGWACAQCSCDGKQCGDDDGCGTTCTACPEGFFCEAAADGYACGQCSCEGPPAKLCGEQDECGVACTDCPTGQWCDTEAGSCADCSCDGKLCGEEDGCGVQCTDCPTGQWCDQEAWGCQDCSCDGVPCGEEDGCGVQCTDCPDGEYCDAETWTCEGCGCEGPPPKSCGEDNGCGMTCTACPDGQWCDEGDWSCKDCSCEGKSCGDEDGCGVKCLDCPADEFCDQESWDCEACSCAGKQCGDEDGCGVQCTDCPDGQWCDESTWGCEECSCEGKLCGDEDGCGTKCTACPDGQFCDPATWACDDCSCAGPPAKSCGDEDGCGNACTACPDGEWCDSGACVVCTCEGPPAKSCGEDDGCGNTCTACPDGSFCDEDTWACEGCDCAGKQCGADDGCGVTCLGCPSGEFCNDDTWTCDGCSCEGKTCGQEDECGVKCTACPDGQVCNQSTWACDDCSCAGKSCGDDDGCGNTCTACPAGQQCDLDLGECFSCDTCQGLTCGTETNCGEQCDTCGGMDGCDCPNSKPVCQDGVCVDGPCEDTCVGKVCGQQNDCGETCLCGSGCSCPPNLPYCVDGQCTSDDDDCEESCAGVTCGSKNGCGTKLCDECDGSEPCGCPNGECLDGQCVDCDCTGKSCGEDDGCGGKCTDCPDLDQACDTGSWQCVGHDPGCPPMGDWCGDLPSGVTCECPSDSECVGEKCLCIGSCGGKLCGEDDGCGNPCSDCPDGGLCDQETGTCDPEGTCDDPSCECMPGQCDTNPCGSDCPDCGTCGDGLLCVNGWCEPDDVVDPECPWGMSDVIIIGDDPHEASVWEYVDMGGGANDWDQAEPTLDGGGEWVDEDDMTLWWVFEADDLCPVDGVTTCIPEPSEYKSETDCGAPGLEDWCIMEGEVGYYEDDLLKYEFVCDPASTTQLFTLEGEVFFRGEWMTFAGTLYVGAYWELNLGVGDLVLSDTLLLHEATLTVAQGSGLKVSGEMCVGPYGCDPEMGLWLEVEGWWEPATDDVLFDSFSLGAELKADTTWRPFPGLDLVVDDLGGKVKQEHTGEQTVSVWGSSGDVPLAAGVVLDDVSVAGTLSNTGAWQVKVGATTSFGAPLDTSVSVEGMLMQSGPAAPVSGCLWAGAEIDLVAEGMPLEEVGLGVCFTGQDKFYVHTEGKLRFETDGPAYDFFGQLQFGQNGWWQIDAWVQAEEAIPLGGFALKQVWVTINPNGITLHAFGKAGEGEDPLWISLDGKYEFDGDWAFKVAKEKHLDWVPFDDFPMTITHLSGSASHQGDVTEIEIEEAEAENIPLGDDITLEAVGIGGKWSSTGDYALSVDAEATVPFFGTIKVEGDLEKKGDVVSGCFDGEVEVIEVAGLEIKDLHVGFCSTVKAGEALETIIQLDGVLVIGGEDVAFAGELEKKGDTWKLTLGVENLLLAEGLLAQEVVFVIAENATVFSLDGTLVIGEAEEALHLAFSGDYHAATHYYWLTVGLAEEGGQAIPWQPDRGLDLTINELSGSLTNDHTGLSLTVLGSATDLFQAGPVSLDELSLDGAFYPSAETWHLLIEATTTVEALAALDVSAEIYKEPGEAVAACFTAETVDGDRELAGAALQNLELEWCIGTPINGDLDKKSQVHTIAGRFPVMPDTLAVAARSADGTRYQAIVDPTTRTFTLNVPAGEEVILSAQVDGEVRRFRFLRNDPATVSGQPPETNWSWYLPILPWVKYLDLGDLEFDDPVWISVGDGADETSPWLLVDTDKDTTADFLDADDDDDGEADWDEESWVAHLTWAGVPNWSVPALWDLFDGLVACDSAGDACYPPETLWLEDDVLDILTTITEVQGRVAQCDGALAVGARVESGQAYKASVDPVKGEFTLHVPKDQAFALGVQCEGVVKPVKFLRNDPNKVGTLPDLVTWSWFFPALTADWELDLGALRWDDAGDGIYLGDAVDEMSPWILVDTDDDGIWDWDDPDDDGDGDADWNDPEFLPTLSWDLYPDWTADDLWQMFVPTDACDPLFEATCVPNHADFPKGPSADQVHTVRGELTDLPAGDGCVAVAVGARTSGGDELKGLVDAERARFSICLPLEQDAALSLACWDAAGAKTVKRLRFLRSAPALNPGAAITDPIDWSWYVPSGAWSRDVDLGVLSWSADALWVSAGDGGMLTSPWQVVDSDGDGTLDWWDADDDADNIPDASDPDYLAPALLWGLWPDWEDPGLWDVFSVDDGCNLADGKVCIPADEEYFGEYECGYASDAATWCAPAGGAGWYYDYAGPAWAFENDASRAAGELRVQGDVTLEGDTTSFEGYLRVGPAWRMAMFVSELDFGPDFVGRDLRLTIDSEGAGDFEIGLEATLDVGDDGSGEPDVILDVGGTYSTTGAFSLGGQLAPGSSWDPFRGQGPIFTMLGASVERAQGGKITAVLTATAEELSIGFMTLEMVSVTGKFDTDGAWMIAFHVEGEDLELGGVTITETMVDGEFFHDGSWSLEMSGMALFGGFVGTLGVHGFLTKESETAPLVGCLSVEADFDTVAAAGVGLEEVILSVCALDNQSVEVHIEGKVDFADNYVGFDGTYTSPHDDVEWGASLYLESDIVLGGIQMSEVTLLLGSHVPKEALCGEGGVFLSAGFYVDALGITATGCFHEDAWGLALEATDWAPFAGVVSADDPLADLFIDTVGGEVVHDATGTNAEIWASVDLPEVTIVPGVSLTNVEVRAKFNPEQGTWELSISGTFVLPLGDDEIVVVISAIVDSSGNFTFYGIANGTFYPFASSGLPLVTDFSIANPWVELHVYGGGGGWEAAVGADFPFCVDVPVADNCGAFAVETGISGGQSVGLYFTGGIMPGQDFVMPYPLDYLEAFAIGVTTHTIYDFDMFDTPDDPTDDFDLKKGVSLASIAKPSIHFNEDQDMDQSLVAVIHFGGATKFSASMAYNFNWVIYDQETAEDPIEEFEQITVPGVELFVEVDGAKVEFGFKGEVAFKPSNGDWFSGVAEIAVGTSGFVVDLYMDGRWKDPLGIERIAIQRPALNLGIGATLISSFGLNGDLFWLRPQYSDWPSDDVWPTDPTFPAPEETARVGGTVYFETTPTESGLCLFSICAITPAVLFRLDIENFSLADMLGFTNDMARATAEDFDGFIAAESIELPPFVQDTFETALGSAFNINHYGLYASTHDLDIWGTTFPPGFRMILDIEILGYDIYSLALLDQYGLLIEFRLPPIELFGHNVITGNPISHYADTGSAGWVQVGHDSRLNVQSSTTENGWTIEGKLRKAGYAGKTFAAKLAEKDDGTHGYTIGAGDAVYRCDAEGACGDWGKIAVQFRNGGTVRTVQTELGVVKPGVWEHIAVTYQESSGEVSIIYAGSRQRVTDTGPVIGPGPSGAPLKLGGAAGGVDDVRFWKLVRQPNEVQNNAYVLLNSQFKPEVIAHWEFDYDTDGTAWNTRVYDGVKLHGTYQGGAYTKLKPEDQDLLFKLALRLPCFGECGGLSSAVDDSSGPGVWVRAGIDTTPYPWPIPDIVAMTEVNISTEALFTKLFMPNFELLNLLDWIAFAITGKGPNFIDQDYDDGMLLELDILTLTVKATVDLVFDNFLLDTRDYLAGASLWIGCPPGKSCGSVFDYLFELKAYIDLTTELLGIPFGLKGNFELDSAEGFIQVVGTLLFGIEVTAIVTISTELIGAEILIEIGTWFGIDFGTVSLGVWLQFDPLALCGKLAGIFGCNLNICLGFVAPIQVSCDWLDCIGHGDCLSDEYCDLFECFDDKTLGQSCVDDDWCDTDVCTGELPLLFIRGTCGCNSCIPGGAACEQDEQCITDKCQWGECTCDTDSNCQSGYYCDNDLLNLIFKNSCEPKKGNHAGCGWDSQCQSNECGGGFLGIGMICYTPSSIGLGGSCKLSEECTTGSCEGGKCTCKSDGQCASGQWCHTNLFASNACESKKNDWAGCGGDNQCKSNECGGGFIGIGDICYTPDSKNYGDACKLQAECTTDVCEGGACGCKSDSQCASTQWCHTDLFAPNRCESKKNDWSGCTGSNQCKSGSCGGGFIGIGDICYTPDSKGLGDSCKINAECTTDLCENGACRCKTDAQCGSGKWCKFELFGSDTCEWKKNDWSGCTGGNQCKSGHCGGGFLGIGMICYTPDSKGVGGACKINEECTTDLCEGGACRCKTDAHCGAGYWCKFDLFGADTCQAKKNDWSGCTGGNQCKSGTCGGGFLGIGDICYTPNSKSINAGCRTSAECTTGLCESDTCVCHADSHCGSGSYCVNELFGANWCKAKLKGPSFCLGGGECASGTCSWFDCKCSSDSHCKSGYICRSGTCEKAYYLNNGQWCSYSWQCKSNHCGKKCTTHCGNQCGFVGCGWFCLEWKCTYVCNTSCDWFNTCH